MQSDIVEHKADDVAVVKTSVDSTGVVSENRLPSNDISHTNDNDTSKAKELRKSIEGDNDLSTPVIDTSLPFVRMSHSNENRDRIRRRIKILEKRSKAINNQNLNKNNVIQSKKHQPSTVGHNNYPNLLPPTTNADPITTNNEIVKEDKKTQKLSHQNNGKITHYIILIISYYIIL